MNLESKYQSLNTTFQKTWERTILQFPDDARGLLRSLTLALLLTTSGGAPYINLPPSPERSPSPTPPIKYIGDTVQISRFDKNGTFILEVTGDNTDNLDRLSGGLRFLQAHGCVVSDYYPGGYHSDKDGTNQPERLIINTYTPECAPNVE